MLGIRARGAAGSRVAPTPHTRRLDAAERPGDLDLPGYRLRPLHSDRVGRWSIRISGYDYALRHQK